MFTDVDHKWGYRFHYPSEQVEVSHSSDIPNIVADRGPSTRHYSYFQWSDGQFVSFDTTNPNYITLEVFAEQASPQAFVDKVEKAFNLQRLDRLIETAFIAHSFDPTGQSYANEVSSFLQLLGLKVTSGKSFAPIQVADKVKERLTKGDILVAIVTPQDHPTWVTQEITLADTLNKSPFILKDADATFKGGILGDREYIEFPKGYISQSFIKILEGLRSLRGHD